MPLEEFIITVFCWVEDSLIAQSKGTVAINAAQIVAVADAASAF